MDNSRRESIIIPMTRKNRTLENIDGYVIAFLLALIGFLATYTFNDFSDTLKQTRQDISQLQISFASLAKHVEDEDAARNSK